MKVLMFVVGVFVVILCLLSAVSATANSYLESRGLVTMTPHVGPWPTATRAVWP